MPNLPIWKPKQQTLKLDHLLPIDSKKQDHSDPDLLHYSKNTIILYLPNVQKTIITNHSFVQTILDQRVFQCIQMSSTKYFLFAEDKYQRYQIYQFDEKYGTLQKINVQGYRPVRKISPILIYQKKFNCFTLLGCQNVHSYELGSPFWRFCCSRRAWFEVQWNLPQVMKYSVPLQDKVLFIEEEKIKVWDFLNSSILSTLDLKLDKKVQKSYGLQQGKAYCYVPQKQTYYFLIKDNSCLLQITTDYARRLDLGIVLDANLNTILLKVNYMNGELFLHQKPIVKHSHARIDLKMYHIKISQLKQIDMKNQNFLLSDYFNLKQYADLVFLVQNREVHCSRELFEHYSPKFRKLYSNSSAKNHKNSSPTIVKLDHAKFPTVYFLIEQLYHNCQLPISTIDQATILDLMILSQKFQIQKLQILCESSIEPTVQIFPRLYDYYRNAELPTFKEQIIKLFVIHSQDLMKTMPIGKVEQIIRLIYSPECQHSNVIEFKSKIGNNYFVRSLESSEYMQYNKGINYGGFLKNEEISLKICQKCHKLLGLGDTHRKNKSMNREMSMGSGHRKRQNNSN